MHLIILLSGCIVTHFQIGLCKPLGVNNGTFDICKNELVISKENFVTIALKKHKIHKIRVLALIDKGLFSETEINPYGWRVVSQAGSIFSLEGDKETAPYLTAIHGIRYVQRPFPFSINASCMDTARKMTNVDQVQGKISSTLTKKFTGKNVLIGNIDTEFDTHHPDFINALGKTRFIALWDQSDSTNPLRQGLTYGKIKSGQALESDSQFGLNGEFHGTLITSYAAGSQLSTPYYGVAPDAFIIGVKYSPQYVEQDVINGLNWIFKIADSINVPCVVNLSIGLASGPHDGTSLTDRAIDSVSTTGHIVVGAVGNDGYSNSHISFTLGIKDTMGTWIEPSIDSLQSPPRATAVSAIDIWGDSGCVLAVTSYIRDIRTGLFKVSGQRVTTQIGRVYNPDLVLWKDSIGNKIDSLVFYPLIVENANLLNHKSHLQLALVSPNISLRYGISMTIQNNVSGTIHAWNIEKKSLLSDSIPAFFNGDNISTVNEIGGTAKRIITVGGYTSKSKIPTWNGVIFDKHDSSEIGKRSFSSGTGPSVDGRTKPDIMAPSDMVVGAMSRLAPDIGQTVIWPDTHSTVGRYTRGTGTSVASPIVAGIIALMLEENPNLTPEQAKSALQSTAIKDSNTGSIAIPNNLWGAGKVNAYGAIAELMGITPAARPIAKNFPEGRLEFYSKNSKLFFKIYFQAEKSDNLQLTLFSLSGRKVVEINKLKEENCISQISKGVYMACLLSNSQVLNRQKVIVW